MRLRRENHRSDESIMKIQNVCRVWNRIILVLWLVIIALLFIKNITIQYNRIPIGDTMSILDMYLEIFADDTIPIIISVICILGIGYSILLLLRKKYISTFFFAFPFINTLVLLFINLAICSDVSVLEKKYSYMFNGAETRFRLMWVLLTVSALICISVSVTAILNHLIKPKLLKTERFGNHGCFSYSSMIKLLSNKMKRMNKEI